jgi:hypothetical protein
VLVLSFVLVAILALPAIAAWWWQVRTPRTIHWKPVEHAGASGLLADGLVLQHDDGSSVWASRGYSIYRSDEGAPFRRVARVRPPVGEAWGGYLRSLRRAYGYQELVELLPLDEDRLVVVSGGFIHVLDLRAGRARRTHRLRYFGRGKGRGLMAFGLCRDLQGALYLAEYVTEGGDRPTGIWKSTDGGESWSLCYEFAATEVRHVHVVHCDPHDGAIWIGTGDRDEHCFVGRSTDGGASFEWVGHGRQIHRTCAFAGFDDVVLWGMDADFEQNHVIRWHRSGGQLSVDAQLPDATYYATRIDDSRALLGVAQGVAQVWIARRDGSAERWLDWTVPAEPPRRGPSPGVRLARGDNRSGPVHVNPLRTIAHESAILRFDRDQLPAP